MKMNESKFIQWKRKGADDLRHGDGDNLGRNKKMRISLQQKNDLKHQLVSCLRKDKEIVRIVIFGSFVNSDNPHDIDVAVFQDSSEGYLPLAMKYRTRTEEVAKILPLDILPLKSKVTTDPFLAEIAKGEVIYER